MLFPIDRTAARQKLKRDTWIARLGSVSCCCFGACCLLCGSYKAGFWASVADEGVEFGAAILLASIPGQGRGARSQRTSPEFPQLEKQHTQQLQYLS
ncbi:hypothetical protein Trisim1_012459 [Trichoderma cf. simile WF8]